MANLCAGQCNNQESGRAEQGMKAWTMVANTDCLLDDESRKAIMLLKGLKGTHLFIPRIGKFRANATLIQLVNVAISFCMLPLPNPLKFELTSAFMHH